MKVKPYCRECLENLVRQAASMATSDPGLQAKAIEAALTVLDNTFSYDSVAPHIATRCAKVIREVTGNPDPYKDMKSREMEMADRLFKEVRGRFGKDLRSCVKLASLGNTIDFFKDLSTVAEEMLMPLDFAVDHLDSFEQKLRAAKRVLYLADNAGECFFDLPLLHKIGEQAKVTYVVKGSPCQNDITLEELNKTGLLEEFGEVITTGSGAVGIELSSVSPEFKSHFDKADLIFAKGMANYETLSEIPACGRVVHCLMAKCLTIAKSLGTPHGSYVVMVR